MAKRKRIFHNPDPLRFIIVRTKEGDVLRSRRGTKKKAPLNEACQQQADDTCSREAKNIREKLEPFLKHVYGRVNVYLSGRLRTGKIAAGKTDYAHCLDWEVVIDHPMEDLFRGPVKVKRENDTLTLDIVHGERYFRLKKKFATHYHFEAILLYGDASVPGDLRTEAEHSAIFPVEGIKEETCSFDFVLPQQKPYMLFFKVSCMENGKYNAHGKHYGMKVVTVG